MDIFPISLRLQQQRCLIVGGGQIALRKATLLHKAGAIIDVVAPEIDSQLLDVVQISAGQHLQALNHLKYVPIQFSFDRHDSEPSYDELGNRPYLSMKKFHDMYLG